MAYTSVQFPDRQNINIGLNMEGTSFQTMYQNFDRWYSVYPEYELSSLHHYIFITRPELNLVNEGNPRSISDTCKNDSWIQYMVRDHNVMTQHLTIGLDVDHDFMPFMVGRAESLQIPDYTLKNFSISQPYTGYLMPYATNANESQTGGTFDITFREDHALRIHKTMYTWAYYIDAINKGLFNPKDKFIFYNKFDYMCSVYHLVTGPDATKLLWWDKYTGAFPYNVPQSDMSFNLRGQVDNKVTISFAYFMHESLTPDIIADFNMNSRAAASSYVPVYDSNIIGTGNGYVGAPFIHRQNSSSFNYNLYWRQPKAV